ncbi:MAG: hypothetical protein HN416_14245 [Nitrospina sp.]|nr:hypothetical protein [Nitrospina sp.]
MLRRLMTASEPTRLEMVQQEDGLIDGDFFTILARFMEAAIAGQDENSARQLNDLQILIIEHSTHGQVLKAETEEIQAAMTSLQELGDQLNQEALLELVTKAPTDTRLRALARLARPGMDYSFFQMISERVDRARGKGKARLTEVREKLLTFTHEVDQEIEQRLLAARKNVETLLQVEDMKAVLQQNIKAVDEFFVQSVTQMLDDARQKGDLSLSAKLQQILDIIQDLSGPPPEFTFIEGLLDISDDEEALTAAIAADSAEITPELMDMFNNLIARTQAGLEQAEGEAKQQQEEIFQRLQVVYNAVLGFSMRRNFEA